MNKQHLCHSKCSQFQEEQRKGHNYKELRVYVESLWRSPQLCDLMQAILDGELKLVKAEELV